MQLVRPPQATRQTKAETIIAQLVPLESLVQTSYGELLYLGKNGRHSGADARFMNITADTKGEVTEVNIYRVSPDSNLTLDKRLAPIPDGGYHKNKGAATFSKHLKYWEGRPK